MQKKKLSKAKESNDFEIIQELTQTIYESVTIVTETIEVVEVQIEYIYEKVEDVSITSEGARKTIIEHKGKLIKEEAEKVSFTSLQMKDAHKIMLKKLEKAKTDQNIAGIAIYTLQTEISEKEMIVSDGICSEYTEELVSIETEVTDFGSTVMTTEVETKKKT